MQIKTLTMENQAEIMEIIRDAFAVAPWNDKWDDEAVFRLYIQDIIGNANSLSLGLYDQDELIGVALGRLKHWYDGIEFCIDDFCIKTACQGKGAGSAFIKLIAQYARENHYKEISLRTKRTAAAYHFYKKNGFDESETNVYFSMRCT